MRDAHTHIPNARVVDLARDRAQITALVDDLLGQAEEHGFGASAIFAVRLAIEEAITNAFEHGHEGLDPSTTIRVEYAVSPRAIEVAIEDQGPGFVPERLPDPTLLENLSKPSGRGVMLMKAYMTDVVFNEKGNRVKLRYLRSQE